MSIKKSQVWGYFLALSDRKLMPTAIKVSLVVGTIIFASDCGDAIFNKKMTRQRWMSGLISYLVPYAVNIHGQYVSRSRK